MYSHFGDLKWGVVDLPPPDAEQSESELTGEALAAFLRTTPLPT
jgi:hypothetical protein